MAAVDFYSAFGYKWGQTGNTITFQDDQYKVGWAFIGDVPPSVEQFNELQQLTDEKANWLFAQLQTAATELGVTLGAGNLSGLLQVIQAITPDASVTVKGLVELATNEETQAGTDATRGVTPAGLSSRTATETRTGLIEIATTAEAQALVNDTHALTPAKLGDVLKNAPVFKAQVNALQTFTSNVTTKVVFGAVQIILGGYYANSRFTPLVPGYYQINACLGVSTNAAGQSAGLFIYKNGQQSASQLLRYTSTSATDYGALSVSDLLFLDGIDDYVEVFVNADAANPFISGSWIGLFSGALVRFA